MKVPLLRDKYDDRSTNPSLTRQRITMALPFFRSANGLLIHRVKSGRVYQYHGEYSHTSVTYWCGNIGYVCPAKRDRRHRSGTFFAEPPENAIHCAICEGKATGAGLNGARIIAGRPVLFQPRT